ncbi:hypothetical protein [Azospirillum endophyticum]
MKFHLLMPLAVSASLLMDPAAAFQMGDATQTVCANGTDSLCSTLPTDMNGHPSVPGYTPTTDTGGTSFNQTFVDYFGWQAFVALNWPLDASGQPSTTQTIVTDTSSPRVWSNYQSKEEVFGTLVAGIENSGCATKKGKLKVFRTSKFELTSFKESFTPYPLIDRYGNFVLYDVRLNNTDVSYLSSNNLTTKAGQSKFAGSYDFPGGKGENVGAIEIKSAWRIMTEKDDKGNYYTTEATIVVPKEYSESGSEMCIDATVGLVGMHIMQKFTNPVSFSNFWSWATFEHIQNAPLADKAPVSQVNKQAAVNTLDPPTCTRFPDPIDTTKYSFYDVACNTAEGACKINTPPKSDTPPKPPGDTSMPLTGEDPVYKWAEKQPYASSYLNKGLGGSFGTQVARCFDIYPSAKNVTEIYRAKLGNSAWSNYMLVGAQWAASGIDSSPVLNKLHPFPAPVYLSNVTMETYLQISPVISPESGSGSCITCHNLATDTTGKTSNFSFLPGNAK